jgi:predicted extracellular nuclease
MRFSIATFNVENLIGAGKPIYNAPKPRYSADEWRAKSAWVREQLLRMNADVVGFQEVFEEQALRDCLKGTRFASWHLTVADPTGKLPVNAVLSRFPIVSREVVTAVPFDFEFFDDKAMSGEDTHLQIPIHRFSRGLLKVVVQVTPKVAVCVIVAHLKSKRPTLPDGLERDEATASHNAQGAIRALIRRGVEACGVRQILSDCLQANPEQPVVVLGDLNDADTAVTNQIILGDAPRHNAPLEEKIEAWKECFQNVRDIQARRSIQDFHYTYIHNGRYESLDNIIVSNHFSDRNPQRVARVVDVRAYNDHLLDNTLSLERKPLSVSDHGQVVASVEIRI